MKKTENFAEVLEAAGSLTLDAQEELIEILQKRTIEHRREKVAKEIRDARSEHKRGRSKPSTADDIIDEILS